MADQEQDIFPPITLEAGRAEWTPRDKLARLVMVSRQIGNFNYAQDAPAGELVEERALFEELATLLDEVVALKHRLYIAEFSG